MEGCGITNLVNDLQLKNGFAWSLLWVILNLLGQGTSMYKALYNGFMFMLLWTFISFVLYVLCYNNIFCLNLNI